MRCELVTLPVWDAAKNESESRDSRSFEYCWSLSTPARNDKAPKHAPLRRTGGRGRALSAVPLGKHRLTVGTTAAKVREYSLGGFGPNGRAERVLRDRRSGGWGCGFLWAALRGNSE